MKWEYKPFQKILSEIADLLYLAQEAPQKATTLSKALLTASVRLLEAVANSIMAAAMIDKNASLRDALDRLSLIEKFDLLLLLRAKKLDRGNAFIQSLNEIIKERNPSAHPKNKLADINSINKGSDGIVYYTTTINPYDSDMENTKNHLKNAFTFLNHYMELARIDNATITQILLDEVVFDNGTRGIMQLGSLIENKAFIESQLAIKIKFITYTPIKISKIYNFTFSIQDNSSTLQFAPYPNLGRITAHCN